MFFSLKYYIISLTFLKFEMLSLNCFFPRSLERLDSDCYWIEQNCLSKEQLFKRGLRCHCHFYFLDKFFKRYYDKISENKSGGKRKLTDESEKLREEDVVTFWKTGRVGVVIGWVDRKRLYVLDIRSGSYVVDKFIVFHSLIGQKKKLESYKHLLPQRVKLHPTRPD